MINIIKSWLMSFPFTGESHFPINLSNQRKRERETLVKGKEHAHIYIYIYVKEHIYI